MTPEDFFSKEWVTRATTQKFELYAQLLREENDHFNLVAESTLPDLWSRHFMDSAQLYPLIPAPSACRLVDMGSGAGFPGLVLAILGVGDVHLIESIGKKADFLSRVVERLELKNVTIHKDRVEKIPFLAADVVTARALKDLRTLVSLARLHVKKSGFMLFPKGKKAEAELTEALKWATFSVEKSPSQTDDSGVILKISRLNLLSKHDRRSGKH
jgi:16S rRNA (guanine527-N7)-methyltransferase